MINQSGGSSETTLTVAATPTKKAIWNEVKSEDGSSYFWNTVTNGSACWTNYIYWYFFSFIRYI